VLNLGARERLDEGLLHLYIPEGLMPSRWHERSARQLTIDVPRHRVQAAIDGEPVALVTPLEFHMEPRALRVLVPNRG
jgi:diacylglycerol kinase family enzyme